MAEPDLTLYYMPMSFYSQKAHLALREKGLKFKSHYLRTQQGCYYPPWYMKINPKGQVPTLQHGDKYIPDSAKIIEYLDDNFPGPKLQPDVKTEIGRKVRQFQQSLDDLNIVTITQGCLGHYPELTVNPGMPFLARKIIKRFWASGLSVTSLEKVAEANPDLRAVYQQKIQDVKNMAAKADSKDTVLAEIEKANQLMALIETELKSRSGEEWLCGNDFTVADVILAVTLRRFNMIGLQQQLFSKEERPLLATYYQRLLKRRTVIDACVNLKMPLPFRLVIYGPPIVGAAIVIGAAAGLGYWLYKRQ